MPTYADLYCPRRPEFPRRRMAHGLRGTPPSDRLLWTATFSSAPTGLRRDRRNDRLRGALGQRSSPVLPPLARRPDGLSSVLAATGRMDLMTTVALPVVRGPVALAKSMAAIDILSGGRLIVGVGPGSSTRDYAAAGIPFEERFKRLDESVETLRALWREDGSPFRGEFYSTEGVVLEPRPSRQPGPPIWIGSWGSEAGLRRTARLGNGWLASAYNTT